MPLDFNVIKQEGDECINEIALRLRLLIKQRVAINKVRIYLQLMLVPNLLTHKRNAIKAA